MHTAPLNKNLSSQHCKYLFSFLIIQIYHILLFYESEKVTKALSPDPVSGLASAPTVIVVPTRAKQTDQLNETERKDIALSKWCQSAHPRSNFKPQGCVYFLLISENQTYQ